MLSEYGKKWAQERLSAERDDQYPDEPELPPELPDEPPGDEPRESVHPDGAALLDDLRDTITTYVVFADKHAAAAIALWIAATHALPAFECAPRLVFTSPQKRCAKSRMLDIIVGTCHEPLAIVNASVASVFRSLGGKHPPTLVIDEADALFGTKRAAENNEDLRALLNAGHQRGRPALRCVGPLQVPTKFDTFAMAALAGIGAMPDTITDRAVNITMRRRAPGESVSQFRSRRDGPKLEKLRARLAEWASWSLENLTGAEPDMPVEDRAADTWEPLVAIADAVGGHWPTTARAACRALVTAADTADEDRSLPTKLLVDIRDIFAAKAVSFLPSAELVAGLRRIEESPWGEFELNASKLAYRLREFGVKTRHNATGAARGYRLEDFWDVFQRYTRQTPSEPSESQVKQGFSSDGLFSNPSEPVGQPVNPSDAVRRSEPSTSDSDGLTLLDGVVDENVPQCAGTAAPGGITPSTPGMTERVREIVARTASNVPQHCADCGEKPAEHDLNDSRVCTGCLLRANDEERPESHPRVRRGGCAVLTIHSSVFGDLTETVRKWHVGDVEPWAQYDRSVAIYCVEPRKRSGKQYRMTPSGERYITIEVDGAVVYDSRDDVPCDMDEWHATRERFPGGACRVIHVPAPSESGQP